MKSLTVIIPTWNRSRYLEKNLEILDSYLKLGLDFNILVCNNGSSDNTSRVLEKWADHPRIKIINHPDNIMYDRNVASGYLNFDTDFCFCLGDTKTLSYESLKKIIRTINEENIDALIINVAEKMSKTSKYYTEINNLMDELGWNLTNISSCVIPKKFINLERCQRYYDSLFIHYGVFIDALCNQETGINVKYDSSIKKEIIDIDDIQPHGWSSNIIDIWTRAWFEFVMSLPCKITLKTKFKVLHDLNRNEKYLAPKKFVIAKINRDSKFYCDYKRNRMLMPFVSKTPLLVYDFLCFIPNCFFQWIRPIIRMTKYRNRLI